MIGSYIMWSAFRKSISKIFLTEPTIGVLCVGFIVIGAWYVSIPSSLDMVNNDDYSWYAALMHMYDATNHRAPLAMMVPNAYYGLIFWWISFISAWPFFIAGSDAGVLIAPRIIEVLFAAGSLAVIAYSIRAELLRRIPVAKTVWLFLMPLMVLAMPAWWLVASRIHPQHMLVFSELVAVWCLVMDRGMLGRFYWWATIAAGAALSLKIEAVMLAPLFISYVAFSYYCNSPTRRPLLIVLSLSVAVPIGVLILLNPYLLTPMGSNAWINTNLRDLIFVVTRKNSTIGGSMLQPISIWERLHLLTSNFYPVILIVGAMAILIIDAVDGARKRKFRASLWLAPYATISLMMCVLWVRNEQPYYWITVMVLLLFSIVPLTHWLQDARRMRAGIVAAVVLSQFIFVGNSVAASISRRAHDEIFSIMLWRYAPIATLKKISHQQAESVKDDLRTAKRPVISPSVNFDYKSFGVRYVEEIYGCLTSKYLKPKSGRIPKPEIDLVIMRKNDVSLTKCSNTIALVQGWRRGTDSSFRLVKETQYIMIFRRAR